MERGLVVSKNQRRRVVRYSLSRWSLLLCALLMIQAGCSVSVEEARKTTRPLRHDVAKQDSPPVIQNVPWEIWPIFRDLNGHAVVSRELLLGDEYRRAGQRALAMEAYQKAATGILSPGEREAVVVRIASQYLFDGDAKQALATIGQYYRDSGKTEAGVNVPFGLVLAFGYGQHGDVDQALAWFSKVFDMGVQGGPAQSVAERGIGALLETVSLGDLERLALDWHADTLVSRYIGAERLKRSSSNYVEREGYTGEPFWKRTDGVALVAVSPVGEISDAPIHSGTSIGVILGLTDKFAALGKDTQRGIELAMANASQAGIASVTEDVGADSTKASAAVRKLVTESQPKVVLGPLLTESSVSASQTARELGVPLVSFSKSEGFNTGRGVYRLGATTSSQVNALVTAAHYGYGMRRFAVAYPNTSSGREYAQLFRNEVTRLGLSIELEVPYEASNDETLAEVARMLEGTSATGLLIPDVIDVSARLVQNLSPQLRRQLRPLGVALWDNVSKIARSQAVFQGALFVSPFFSQSSREEVVSFVSSFKAKYGTSPNFLAAQGYDAANLVVAALKAESRQEGSFEAMLLQAPPLNGVTGVLSTTASGEIMRTFYVVEVLKDTFQELLPSERSTSEYIGDSLNGAAMERSTSFLGAESAVSTSGSIQVGDG
jgi:branched-chain amino acid transport system substrate-binding protein